MTKKAEAVTCGDKDSGGIGEDASVMVMKVVVVLNIVKSVAMCVSECNGGGRGQWQGCKKKIVAVVVGVMEAVKVLEVEDESCPRASVTSPGEANTPSLLCSTAATLQFPGAVSTLDCQ